MKAVRVSPGPRPSKPISGILRSVGSLVRRKACVCNRLLVSGKRILTELAVCYQEVLAIDGIEGVLLLCTSIKRENW